MDAMVLYCNCMSYHKPDIFYVYAGAPDNLRSEAQILQTAARQINWDGSIKPGEMGELTVIGYRPCTH